MHHERFGAQYSELRALRVLVTKPSSLGQLHRSASWRDSRQLTPSARGLLTLYTSALLAGMWSMIVPAVPVIATSFGVSPGTAAQMITALALGRFIGMPISGTVLDRLGTRAALTTGPVLACSAALLTGVTPVVRSDLGLGVHDRHRREHLGHRPRSRRHRSRASGSTRPDPERLSRHQQSRPRLRTFAGRLAHRERRLPRGLFRLRRLRRGIRVLGRRGHADPCCDNPDYVLIVARPRVGLCRLCDNGCSA